MPAHRIRSKSVSLIDDGTIVTPRRVIKGGSILVENGRIVEVRERVDSASAKADTSGRVDARNKIVIPGMIDIHTHGLEGGSVFDCSVDSIRKMSESFPRHGVTSFLPTTGAASQQMLLQTAHAVVDLMEEEGPFGGAELLGMNLEGPFISKAKPGAQPIGFIRDPDFDEFSQIYEESKGGVKLITVAPELQGALDFIRKVKAKGITVAAGHSNATYEEMLAGIDAGISHASHTFNAMREFKHRDPGMIAAILLRDDITAELIADNVHVHEGAMRLLIKTKGAGNVALISDSMPFAGMPDGKYDMVGFKIEVRNGVITLPSGQLAGSAITLDRSLKIVSDQLRVPLQDAVKMVTANPARITKNDARKGSIEEGKDADIVLLNNEDFSVYATIMRGRLIQG